MLVNTMTFSSWTAQGGHHWIQRNCQKVIVGFLWLMIHSVGWSKEFYVSPTGSDTNSGSLELPFAKIQTAVNKLQPGDTLFIRGGIYRERVSFPRSGTIHQRIVVEGYPGEKPVISGCEPITQWTLWDSTNNIWKAPMRWTLGIGRNQIFSHGQVMVEARYPNRPSPGLEMPIEGLSPLWPTYGYFSVPKGSSTNRPGLVVSELLRNQAPDFWKGAIYVGVHWDGYGSQSGIIESSKEGEIVVGKRTSQWWFTGENYHDKEFGRGMIIGHLHALDQPGEWHWQDDNLYFIPPEGKPLSSVEAKARQLALDLSQRSYITIRGVDLFAASARLENCVDCLIENCQFEYLSHFTRMWALDSPEQGRDAIRDGEAGIYVSGHDNGIVGCHIHVSAGAGINVRGYHQIIHNNLVDEVDYVGHYLNAVSEGIGDSLDTEHQLVGGHVISFNTLRNAGRHFYNIHSGYAANSHNRAPMDYMASLFVHNHLYNGMLLTRDAGFIDSFFSSGGTLNGLRTQIAYNVMHDDFDLEGLRTEILGMVYLDGGSQDYDVHHNLFWARRGTVQNGIFVNTGHLNVLVTNNVFLGRFEGTMEDLEHGQFPGGKAFAFGHDFSEKPSIPHWPPIQSKLLPVKEYLRNDKMLPQPPQFIAAGDVLNLGEVDFAEGWSSFLVSFASDSPGLPKKSTPPKGARHKRISDPLVLDSPDIDDRHLSPHASEGPQFARLEPNGWLRFDQVNFAEGYRRFRLVFANTNTLPRRIEIRLDTPDGPTIAEINLPQSDKYRRNQTWGFAEAMGELSPIATNVHSVFVVGRAEDKQLVGVFEYLRFEQYKGERNYGGAEPRIEIHIDRPTGAQVGDIFPRATGGQRTFVDLVARLHAPTGAHPVFLVAKSAQSGVLGTMSNMRMERAYATNLWSNPQENVSPHRSKHEVEKSSSHQSSKPKTTLFNPGPIHHLVRPMVVASPLPSGFILDGHLSEWTSKPLILRKSLDGIPLSGESTKVWMARDSEALYFAAEAPISAGLKVVSMDELPWEKMEWMEIALSPGRDADASVIHAFRGRIDGTLSGMNPERLGVEWVGKELPGVEFKAARSESSWGCEWRIPFSAVGIRGTPPDNWLCNLSLVSPNTELSRTWACRWGSTYDLDRNGGELWSGPADSILPEALKKRFLAWFDAFEMSTIEHGKNGNVSAWHDRARTSFVATQAQPANQPFFEPNGLNGKPTIRFNGSEKTFLTAPSLDDTSEPTTGIVVFSNPNPSQPPVAHQRLFVTSDGVKDDYLSGLTIAVDKLETGGPRIAKATMKSAALKQPRMGAMSPRAGTFLTGSISEIIVCKGAITEEEEVIIDAYLRSKWGLELR